MRRGKIGALLGLAFCSVVLAVVAVVGARWQVPTAATPAFEPRRAGPTAPRSPHWPGVRKAHLLKEPSCAACGGTEDLEVHHVLPFHRQPERELDPDNLITLCEKAGHCCHLNVGHLGDYKSWNPDVREDAAWWLRKRQKRPY